MIAIRCLEFALQIPCQNNVLTHENIKNAFVHDTIIITTKPQDYPWRNKENRNKQELVPTLAGNVRLQQTAQQSRIIVETHGVSPDYQSAHALCNPSLKTVHRTVSLTLRHGHAKNHVR